MSKKANTDRLPPFVPLLCTTLDSPAWRAMSYGARSLYVALKRRVFHTRNTGYLSCRQAAKELGSSKTRVARWFRELEHYGFIVKVRPHALGVDGKGKSPHWRLTEKGLTSQTSPTGIPEPPTRDFLKWDGTKFNPDSKNKTPATREGQGVHPSGTPVATHKGHPKSKVSTEGGHSNGRKCPAIGYISSSHYVAENEAAPVAEAEATSSSDAVVNGYPELPEFLRRSGP